MKRSRSAFSAAPKDISTAEYHRQYRLQNKDRNAYRIELLENDSDARTAYHRQYRLQHKDKSAEFRWLNDTSVAEYNRQYRLQNKDRSAQYRNGDSREELERKEKKAEFRDRNKDLMVEYRRQLLERKERKIENGTRNSSTRAQNNASRWEYHRKYYLRNKDKKLDSQTRSNNSRSEYVTEYQRQYSRGKQEYSNWYLKLYIGTQKSYQSWKTPETVREYFETLAAHLDISNFVDWYRISSRQLDQPGLSLCKKFGSLGGALQFAYPEVSWDLSQFRLRGKKRAGQRFLKLKIEELLPGIDIIEDYQHPELIWDDSERCMELDLWIPEHRIGIEFQGEQHYFNVDVFGPSNGTGAYSERDIQKHKLCEARQISLVQIPYWWDGSLDALAATLRQSRPDVFPVSHASPIAREIPGRSAFTLLQCTE